VTERRLPPVALGADVSLALAIVSAIYLASYLPRRPPLAPAIALLAAAGAVLLVTVAALARVHDFAWPRFFQVAGWSLVGYAVVAGMLEYVFLYDRTRGAMLVLMTLTLVVFAVNVPLLLAFSVARYEEA
jgi:hypothetical protein